MIVPIRCFNCKKVIGDQWNKYLTMINDGVDSNEALTKCGFERYCCKNMFVSHVDLV